MAKNESIPALLGKTVVEFASTILRAFTLTMLWTWFIVATFAAPALSIPAAIGVILIVRLMGIPAIPSAVSKGLDTWGERQGFNIMLSLIVLGIGYLASLFM